MFSGGELPCPRINVNTQSRKNAENTQNVASWGACSELCRQRQGCTAWTWHHANSGIWAFKCVTITGYGYTIHDTNVVSGGRTCEAGTFFRMLQGKFECKIIHRYVINNVVRMLSANEPLVLLLFQQPVQ